MLFYLIILLLFFFILISYYKNGVSYPINFLTITFLFYFPLKYFAYYFFEIDPLDYLTLNDLGYPGLCLLFFFLISYLSFLFFQKSKLYSIVSNIEIKEKVPFGAFSYFFLFATFLVLILYAGKDILSRPLEVRILMTSNGMYYFTIILQFFTTFYSLQLLVNRKFKKLIIFSLVYAFFSFISGRAALQAYYIINLLLFWEIYFGKKIIKYLLLTIPIILIYVVATGIYRTVTYHSSLSSSEIAQGTSFIIDNKDILFKFFLEKLLYRIDQLDQLSIMIKALQNNSLSYSFGAHMGGVFFQGIPRFIWETKPLNFTAWMTYHFHPEVYLEGHGNNFTGIGEFYFNFGMIGVFSGALFYGFLIYLSCLMWKKARGNFFWTYLLIYLVIPYISTGVLAGFVNDLALPNIIFSSLLIVVFLNFYKIKILKSDTLNNKNCHK